MPCYQVNLMTVEFKAANLDMLLAAIKEACQNYTIKVEDQIISIGFFNPIQINLAAQTVTCTKDDQIIVNDIKRAYSRQIIEAVAKKKHWLVKKSTDQNKLELRRY